MGRDYTVFVQLLDAKNRWVAGHDTQPLGGEYPTSSWRPGEVVVDDHVLQLPDDLPPGTYRLVTGMYDLATGRRLIVADAKGEAQPDSMIVLRELRLTQ